MAGEQDVVVADGVRQEIAGVLRAEAQPDLRAAEVGFPLVAEGLSFGDERAVQLAGEFEYGDGAEGEVPVDADAYAGFEVDRLTAVSLTGRCQGGDRLRVHQWTSGQIQCGRVICAMEQDPVSNREEVLTPAPTWMDLRTRC